MMVPGKAVLFISLVILLRETRNQKSREEGERGKSMGKVTFSNMSPASANRRVAFERC